MIDIETMATGSNAAIVSIGAVEFDLNTGHTGRTFYCNINLQSCLDAGLQVDGNTIMWWMKQADEARQSLFQQPVPLPEALRDFTTYLTACGAPSAQVWGNSARFDLGKLDDAYKAVNLPLPWKFKFERDVRTLVAFAPHLKEQEPRAGTHHNALADCFHQISYCSRIWRTLRPAGATTEGE